MVREVVAAVRSKRGLYPERRDAEPQVMGLAPRTTKEWKPETIKTCLLRNTNSVEPQKCNNNLTGANQVLEAQTARTIRSPSPRPSPSGRGRRLVPLSAVSEAVRDTDAIFSARGGAIVLPLSEGEGRGEGEGLGRLDPCSKAHLRPNLNFRSMCSPDAVTLPRADEEQASIRDGGRGVIAGADIVHREHAKFRAGLKHVAFAGVREEQMSRRIRNRAGPRRRYPIQPLGIDQLSRRRLETFQHRRRVQPI